MNAPAGRREGSRTGPNRVADEPTDPNPLRFPEPVHLAVAALSQNDPVPAVRTLPALLHDAAEPRGTIVEFHAALEVPQHLRVHAAQHAYRVFAIHPVARVHEAVRELAVGREQHHPGGVDVKPANRHPALITKAGQALEDGGTALRVAAGGHLSGRLVIKEQAARRGGRNVHPAPVDPDPIPGADPGSGGGDPSVDPDPPFRHPAVHRPARGNPGCGEKLLDPLVGGLLPRARRRRRRRVIALAPALVRPLAGRRGRRPRPPSRSVRGRVPFPRVPPGRS